MRALKLMSRTSAFALACALLAVARTAAGHISPDGGMTDEPCGRCEPFACPLAEVGQPCEGGTCTQATCEGGDAGRQTCAVCASPQTGACSQAQVGQACPDGGVCTMMDTRSLGPAGAPPPANLYYPVSVCVVTPATPEGGALDVDAAAEHTLPSNDAAAPSDAPPGASTAPSGGKGCDLSGGATGLSAGGLWLLLGGLVSAVRRRRGRGRAAGVRP